jgi:hypothetical protein
MDTGAQQNPSASDVQMDTGAQPDVSNTADNAGAGDKSAGIDKGKGPAIPEVQTTPAPSSAGQATSAALEQAAPETPSIEKTYVPAKPAAPAKTTVPAKSGTLKIRPTKPGTQSAATAPAKAAPRPSSALALHFGKGAARPSFFDTLELEGRVSLLTKRDKSLVSLKEHCIRWNDADSMDTADSRSKKLAEASATGNPADILAAKPVPIACELLSLQQRLHLLADATNVSLFYIYISPVPKNVGCPGYGSRDFPIPFALSCFQINYPAYKLDPSFKS